jgi:pimeloyl-ACP methyl ester carboxylesterase
VSRDAHPVVLVHGLSGSGGWWREVVPELERDHDVRVLDLPRRLNLEDAAAWLAERLTEDGLERADLVGHSMGGLICARLAADRPKLVGRLVLIAPAGVSGGSRRSHVLPLARALRRSSPRLLPHLVRDAVKAGPLTLWRATGEVLEADVRAHLEVIAAPTLVVWGGRDALLPPALGEVFRAEIPHATLVVLERAGHVPMFDAVDELNRELTAFLR